MKRRNIWLRTELDDRISALAKHLGKSYTETIIDLAERGYVTWYAMEKAIVQLSQKEYKAIVEQGVEVSRLKN